MSRCVSRFWPFVLCLLAFGARADIVTDWADTTTQIADDGPNTIRTMALAQNAVYEAVNAITARYPRDRVDLGPTQGASVEAAVAAASRAVLLQELARRGWGDADLAKVAGGNLLRVMAQAEAVSARLRAARSPSRATLEALDAPAKPAARQGQGRAGCAPCTG